MTSFFALARKAIRKPPHVVLARARAEAAIVWERATLARFGPPCAIDQVLRALGDASVDACWARLRARPYPAVTQRVDPRALDEACPGERERVLAAADRALRHEVALLGMAPTRLGARIDWHTDHKTGKRWPPAHHAGISYATPADASDVKISWEISRLQWALPLCRAYQLTGDERYAAEMRDLIDSWIDGNPYAGSVNWSCTMEVALRIVSWTYAFHVCAASEPWADGAFRTRFLRTLFLHARFTRRHFELSDVNGNHCTADAAGLVFAGLFFGRGRAAEDWLEYGWSVLGAELPRQVFADGVDFEASTAYHRLVLELFFLPALYRQRCGQSVPAAYVDRVAAMARFAAHYVDADGTAPYWGDADDARALPLGTQPITDHRYLAGWVGAAWGRPELLALATGPSAETFWSLGPDAVRQLSAASRGAATSASFPDGGFYVMRAGGHHAFIDCGPLGLAGRGGHGHNDCLSFQLALDGIPLVTDCGSYVYTASYEERNHFRSTALHNTPQVDGEEQNRFISPLHLWNLLDDAGPRVERWDVADDRDLFVGTHTGYERLVEPISPVRTIALDKRSGLFAVHDRFVGRGRHALSVPLHFAAGLSVSPYVTTAGETPRLWRLEVGERTFLLAWEGEGWDARLEPARVSPSYGVVVETRRLLWQTTWTGHQTLLCTIWPEASGAVGRLSESRDAALDQARRLLGVATRELGASENRVGE